MSRPLRSQERPILSVIGDAGSPGPIPDGAEAPALKATDGAGELLVGIHSPATFEADQYRVLRHNLERMRPSGRLGVVAVTSAGAGEGKTTTALNLAGALAQSPGARVLLVDVARIERQQVDLLPRDGKQGPGQRRVHARTLGRNHLAGGVAEVVA